MSIEHFYEDYAPTPRLLEQVQKEKTRFNDYSPPLVFLAHRLTEAARKELVEKNDELIKHFNLESSAEDGDLILNHSTREICTILFSSVVVGIHEALEDGEFNYTNLTTRIDNATQGTLIRKTVDPAKITHIEPDEKGVVREPIDRNTLVAMRNAQLEDPTLAIFFENPDLLPSGLRSQFTNTPFYGEISNIASTWKGVARHLFEPSTSSTDEFSPLYREQLNDLLKGF